MGVSIDRNHGSNAVQSPEKTKEKVPVTKTVEVRNSEELKNALSSAESGTKIHLADGVYEGNFSLNGKSGVTIEGSKNAVIKGGNDGYALHLENSNNNTLTGFTVSGGQKGIVLDGSSDNVLDGLTVKDTGQEGIHFRKNSSNNLLQNSSIDNTGLTDPGFGEGVYIGSDPKNFPDDQSNGNMIINNVFGPNVRAENIDIKEGTSGGIVRGNTFNGSGLSGEHFADSVVDIKANTHGYLIDSNIFTGGGGRITFEPGAQASNRVNPGDIF
ncbi:NosD domain-containing protein [Noviherbaspirillum malthae]|jgi:parallel beta-helix repeat protein|uniref:NosD domain-containing protein n=1 Tax=Noviherbaspirillum malthae TaxID=1260987 RepID=UPI00188F5B7D|nr:right-handed parallel beta-helix repeat-containing protein [Noviherbaspirillum malthae]